MSCLVMEYVYMYLTGCQSLGFLFVGVDFLVLFPSGRSIHVFFRANSRLQSDIDDWMSCMADVVTFNESRITAPRMAAFEELRMFLNAQDVFPMLIDIVTYLISFFFKVGYIGPFLQQRRVRILFVPTFGVYCFPYL